MRKPTTTPYVEIRRNQVKKGDVYSVFALERYGINFRIFNPGFIPRKELNKLNMLFNNVIVLRNNNNKKITIKKGITFARSIKFPQP